MLKVPVRALCLATVVLAAQDTDTTRIADAQVAAPPVSTATIRVLIPSAPGVPPSTIYAVLGPGIRLNTAVSPPRLEVDLPASPPIRQTVLARAGDGAWMLPADVTGAVAIARNGLAMAPGRDYIRDGQAIRFTPAQGSLPADIILATF